MFDELMKLYESGQTRPPHKPAATAVAYGPTKTKSSEFRSETSLRFNKSELKLKPAIAKDYDRSLCESSLKRLRNIRSLPNTSAAHKEAALNAKIFQNLESQLDLHTQPILQGNDGSNKDHLDVSGNIVRSAKKRILEIAPKVIEVPKDSNGFTPTSSIGVSAMSCDSSGHGTTISADLLQRESNIGNELNPIHHYSSDVFTKRNAVLVSAVLEEAFTPKSRIVSK